MSSNNEPVREMTREIMEILFDKKESLGDNNYVRCSDLLQNIHNHSFMDRKSMTMISTLCEQEIRLREQLMDEKQKFIDVINDLLKMVGHSARNGTMKIQSADLMELIREHTDDHDEDYESVVVGDDTEQID